MNDSPFISGFRDLLTKHQITAPNFAHGTKSFDGRVLYAGPMFDDKEIVAGVRALVEGKWAVAGEYCRRFEQAFSKYIGQKESVFVNSGSSADLLMVAAAKKRFGWKDGDGVIVSPVGFPTTISAITLNGLKPIFVDIEWETLNFDINKILMDIPELSAPICAIMISPVLGNPPDMDLLVEMSRRFDVTLLLDGCDSLGTLWRGKHLSDYADVTTCSFYPAHHITTLQGGMVSSNDTEIVDIARQMSAWGRKCYCTGAANMSCNGTCGTRFSAWIPEMSDVIVDHRYTYEHQGYNLQQTDQAAAMGLEQLAKASSFYVARRANFDALKDIFSKVKGTRTVEIHPEADPSWFGYPVICDDHEVKKALVGALENDLVQTRGYFGGNILLHGSYRELGDYRLYPNANEVLRRVFFVGVAPHIGLQHLAHIRAALQPFIL